MTNICPSCRCVFIRPFVCTTCGAERLYDATVTSLTSCLDAARAENERLWTVVRAADAMRDEAYGPSRAIRDFDAARAALEQKP